MIIPMSAKQVSIQCTNDCTELPSVLPGKYGGSFNFTQADSPQACCTCTGSIVTLFVNATIWAARGLCVDMFHSTVYYSSALCIATIPIRPKMRVKCIHKKNNKPTKLIHKNLLTSRNFKAFFFMDGILYIYTAMAYKW